MLAPSASRMITTIAVARIYRPMCNVVIEVYEQVVVVDQSQTRRTSLASGPSLATGELLVIHHECAVKAELDA